MLNKKLLIDVNEFFTHEDEAFKKELKIKRMLVDIACEFIKYRTDRNISQNQLADKLGISKTMVIKLESGDYDPTVQTVNIFQKLGKTWCKISWL